MTTTSPASKLTGTAAISVAEAFGLTLNKHADPTEDLSAVWWAWHDAHYSRVSPSMTEAEERCAAWISGRSDDGPARTVSVAEAREIAAQDPSLIWIDAAAVASAISDRQIRALKSEALAVSDYAQVDLCDRALALDTTDQDGNEIALAEMSREAARVECARAIAAARAVRS